MIATREYILGNLNRALEENWVEVWLQPQVRSLSGELCGFEALARWRDPQEGILLPPGAFIDLLEEEGQLHLLDSYMVRQICALLHRELRAGHDVVPISFNLSLADFQGCDIVGVLEECSARYDIPRVDLRVEITESVLARDPELFRREIERIHRDGFEVWMDDFGSGFSSLNILKDFDFDLLKVDKAFLSDFSERSRSIVASALHMAKEIGVHTLTEGVETPEQAQFLRRTGCEILQGFHYGYPLPADEALAAVHGQGLAFERRMDIRYWNQVGEVLLQSDLPLALVEDDGEAFRTVFLSAAHRSARRSAGFRLVAEGEEYFTDDDPIYRLQMIPFLHALPDDGQMHDLFIANGGFYLHVMARLAASSGRRRMYEINFFNITASEDVRNRDALEGIMRETSQLFTEVLEIDPEEGQIRLLMGNHTPFLERQQPLLEFVHWSAENLVYAQDADRYRAFLCDGDLRERARMSAQGYLADYFRVRRENGQYDWEELFAVPCQEKESDHVYIFMHPSPMNDADIAHRLFSTMHPQVHRSEADGNPDAPLLADVWSNFLQSGTLRFFWKDRDRRFLGASRAFLDYYGFGSEEEILGKTDEEMHWHVDNGPFHDDEIEVIREGKHILMSPGKCIIRGQLHSILATKFPVYRGGRIVGLAGFFQDAEEEREQASGMERLRMTDPVTGLLNTHGILAAARDYSESYSRTREDFTMYRFHLGGYSRLVGAYGISGINRILRQIGDVLREDLGAEAVIAYYGSGDVMAINREVDEQAQGRFMARVKRDVESIRRVGDMDCTFYLTAACAAMHETEDLDQLYALLERRIRRCTEGAGDEE